MFQAQFYMETTVAETCKLICPSFIDDTDRLRDINDDGEVLQDGEVGDHGSGKYSLPEYFPQHG